MAAAVRRPDAEGSSLPRDNSVQRMLELERKMKVEQLEACGYVDKEHPILPSSRTTSLTMRSPTFPQRSVFSDSTMGQRCSSSVSNNRQESSNSSRRPARRSLHITVPTFGASGQRTASGESDRPPSSHCGHEHDAESEAESICHSPTWENYGRRKKEQKGSDGRAKGEQEHHARLQKRRPQTKPPSASKTHFLMERQLNLPLLSSRGRSLSTGEMPPSQQDEMTRHRRDRSESLTRRVRASLGAMRREFGSKKVDGNDERHANDHEDSAEEDGGPFVGGDKLTRHRKARSIQSYGGNGNHFEHDNRPASPISASFEASARNGPRTSGSGHAFDRINRDHEIGSNADGAGGSPTGVADVLHPDDESMSPHLLRHKVAFPERTSAQNGTAGQSVVSLAASVHTIITRQGNKSHGQRTSTNENEASCTDRDCHFEKQDSRRNRSSARLSTLLPREKRNSMTDAMRSRTTICIDDNEHEDCHVVDIDGYPPSVPYSSTVEAHGSLPSPSSATSRRHKSLHLGRNPYPPNASMTSTIFSTEERPSRGRARSFGSGARERSASAIRSIRDAARGVFQRRASSKSRELTSRAAASPSPAWTHDADDSRPTTATTAFSQEISNGDYHGHCRINSHESHDSSHGYIDDAISGGPWQSKHHHHSHHLSSPRTFDRPSDGSSISSYDTSLSHPSSVTTPSTSRPQSENGFGPNNGGLSGSEAKNVPALSLFGSAVGGSSSREVDSRKEEWPDRQDTNVYDFPSAPTPPLAPKSSKRALVKRGVDQTQLPQKQQEEENWSVHTGGEDDDECDNFSRASLIPEPLIVSPRNSSQLERVKLDDEERPSTVGSISAARGRLGMTCTDGQGYTSFPESMSNPNFPNRSVRPPAPAPTSTSNGPASSPKPPTPSRLRLQKRTTPSSNSNSTLPSPTMRLKPSSLTTSDGPAIPERRHLVRQSDAEMQGTKPVAKVFVECCQCRFYLDMPSRVYECMVHPEGTVEDAELGVHGVVTRSVRCPWCSHGMSTGCCRGYAAVVHLKERLH